MIDDALRTMIEDAVRRVLREELAREPDRDRYLTVKQAADHAAVSADTIRTWLAAGRLTRYRAGRCVRVKLSELERALQGEDEASPEAEALHLLHGGRVR